MERDGQEFDCRKFQRTQVDGHRECTANGDHSALRRDGIPFNTQQGRQWIIEAFQTSIEVMEAE